MPKLNLDTIPQTNATGYPAPFDAAVQGRWYRRLALAGGLGEMGVSHVTLKPGAWSSQRHWHEEEDEFLVILSGEAMLVDDNGETPMRPGDCAAFPKGDPNGHHLRNNSDADCVFLVVGRPSASDCHYPDIDLHLFNGIGFRRKDGTPHDAPSKE